MRSKELFGYIAAAALVAIGATAIVYTVSLFILILGVM